MSSLIQARENAVRSQHQIAVATQEMYRWISSLSVYCSQVADIRPVSSCEFSPDSMHLITSGWYISYIFDLHSHKIK